jgi:hypothetical protein
MSNSTHRVNVVKIEEILPHSNADTLGIVYIGGYQCVVKKDAYKVGDLALYIQPDTIVPVHPAFAFLWADREFADGTIPERLRRITVRKFRGNWSEGLLMPLVEFEELLIPMAARDGRLPSVAEGDDVAELLGFSHYEEPEPAPQMHGKQYKVLPKSLRGWFWYILAKLHIYRPTVYGADCCKAPKQFSPVYDVEGFKNYPRTFVEGEEVFVTEKIHGSNGRYQFGSADQKMHVGSHNYWKSEKSTCIWRRALAQNPWLSEFCTQHPDHTVYLEVVPTQKGYTYGCTGDETKAFVFDVLRPDGTWVDKRDLYGMDPLGLGQHLVPLLNGHCKAFNLDEIKTLVEGPSTVPGAKHLREGIVISSATERTVRGLGRAQLKLKSMKFLESEGKA